MSLKLIKATSNIENNMHACHNLKIVNEVIKQCEKNEWIYSYINLNLFILVLLCHTHICSMVLAPIISLIFKKKICTMWSNKKHSNIPDYRGLIIKLYPEILAAITQHPKNMKIDKFILHLFFFFFYQFFAIVDFDQFLS